MTRTTEQPLARFIDRHTMVYDRRYAHPIERVWDAVTTAEHLDAWMIPEVRVERRLGGACRFGWGGAADDANATRSEVTVWEPTTAVEYTSSDGSFMRFDLTADGDDATLLSFTMHFLAPPDNAPVTDPGGDLPGGLDTAWRPGFLAGYHEFLDRLDPVLSGTWSLADTRRKLNRTLGEGFDDDDLELQARYRQHVIDTIPPA